MNRPILFVFSILMTISFVSCINDDNNEVDNNEVDNNEVDNNEVDNNEVDKVALPTYCDILINELNKHSEDYDGELERLGHNYYMTLDSLDQVNWIKEGWECYDEYLINYGANTTNY